MVAGAFLGLAILAKGLVPLVLFVPAIWYLRRQPWRVASMLAVALVVAAPWYILVTLRNGSPFLDEFFVKHHFASFATGALQHDGRSGSTCRCLLAALFPWTPLISGLFRRSLYAGARAVPAACGGIWVRFLLRFPKQIAGISVAAAARAGDPAGSGSRAG